MFGLNKEGLSAHDLIAFAKAEKEVKQNPLSLFEKAAEVAKLVGIDSVNIPGRTMAAVSKSAAQKAFPGERFSATCPPGYGPKFRYPPNLERQDVEKALGGLISRKGNMTDSSTDYFDSYSRINIDGIWIDFEAPMVSKDKELQRAQTEEKKDEPITSIPTSFDQEAVPLDPQDDLQAAMESNAARQNATQVRASETDER